jgi:UDP-N-acetylmuramyl pentapeptide phosphotransferase/UDP-N-acetylglucosamine-1-phosphate transferase
MSYLIVFSVSLLVSVLLVFTQSWHGRWTLDSTLGIQKMHTLPTPRIGGVAIAAGLIAAYMLSDLKVQRILGHLLVAGVPAFVFGLLEDLTKKISVRVRLFATMSSGFLAVYLSGVSMQDTGFAPLDWLLGYTFISVLFTGFAVGGIANAINIIDGFNGLAAGSSAIMMTAIGLISLQVGDLDLAKVCFLLVSIVIGFALLNWPKGKLFLGDGGAYLIGFVLAWMAVKLPMRHAEINAWTTLLVCTYPVLEVGFSVLRRRNRAGGQSVKPDKAHLHHLLHRRIICQRFPKYSALFKNNLTSPVCWFATAIPAAWAIAFSKNTEMLALGFFGFLLIYAFIYARLSQFSWCFSTKKC